MAVCSDEKKEVDDSDDDDSLNNVFAFSSNKEQGIRKKTEGLLTSNWWGSTIDRRIKIRFDKRVFRRTSYTSLCQLTARYPNGRKAVGSASGGVGVGRKCHRKENLVWFITCAHNLVMWSSLDKRPVSYKKRKIYGKREGWKKWAYKLQDCNKPIVHPKYDGQSDCGFDLGIILFTEIPVFTAEKREVKEDKSLHWMNPKDVSEGMTVEVSGYPGEKNGYPYTHEGEILCVRQSDLGGWVLYYKADTTPGNSGSPIYLTDKEYLKKHGKSGVDKLLIGVHTGHDDANTINFGTMLTRSIQRWLSKEFDNFNLGNILSF